MNNPHKIVNSTGRDNNVNPPIVDIQSQVSKIEGLTELERFHEATQLCESLMANYPDKPIGFVKLVRIAFKQQDYVLTFQRCEQFLKLFPKELSLLIFKAEALTAIGALDEAEAIWRKLADSFPKNPSGYVGLTRIAFKRQNYALTLSLCEQLIADFPSVPNFLNLKTEALINLGRLEEAEQVSQILADQFPDKPLGYLGLTRIAFKNQDYELTLVCCEQWLTRFPCEPSLLRFKAEALINLERLEEAEQVSQILANQFPDKPFGSLGLTRIAFKKQDYELTIACCERWPTLLPYEPSLLRFKAEALINLERLEEAEQVSQILANQFPDKPFGCLGLARIAFKKRDYSLTLECCEHCLPDFPNELALLNLKNEALINLDRLEEAEQLCILLSDKFPDKALGFVGLARIALKRQDYNLTLEHCRQLIPLFPNDFFLLISKAEALLSLSFFDEAEQICVTLNSYFPVRPASYLLLARISFLQGHYENAIERCHKALELFPDEIACSQLLANALIALFRFEEAKHLFQTIIHTHPDKPNGYFGFARVAAAQSEHEEALKQCGTVLDLFPLEIDAISLKANTLLALSRLEEAQRLFEQMTYKFPCLVNGYAGLYQLYRKLEKHHLALAAINRAYQINPRNISVINQYVMILELMGEANRAYKLLEHHVEKLKHTACLVPLVNLYSKYGETSKILGLLETNSQFFSGHTALQVKVGLALRNKGNIIAAYTLFQNYLDNNNISLAALKSKYRVYEQLCLLQSIIENHALFKHHYLHSISLPTPYLFKDKLCNEIIDRVKIGDFSTCENLLAKELRGAALSPLMFFTRKVVEYAKELDQISTGFSESFLDTGESPIAALSLSETLISKIENKIPTSMLRLGDGEGNFLTYPPQYEQWHENDVEDIQRIWWGDVKIEKQEYSHIESLFAEAVVNADILGIPDLVRKVRDMASFDGVANHRHNRGIEAIFHHLKIHRNLASNIPKRILTSCHYHTDLEFWDLYRYILTNVRHVTVITCHSDLGKVIRDKFGIITVQTILIPSEHRHSHNFNTHEDNNSHYPDYFEKILNTLVVETGDVFLVAAGFLGKIYCNEIKNKGGIGIDIGSTADIWMGFSTRLEHEFLHPILGVTLDFDTLRANRFPGYGKTEKKGYYRSNFFCDMNIYQSGDESEVALTPERKTLLITGHPRCGSRYMSLLLKRLGIDTNHEWFGGDGICSWLYAVKDLNMPIFGKHLISPSASYATVFDYTIAYVRNPFEAVSSIMLENRVERSYNFRRNHIIDRLETDIDDYKSDLERAIASFLLWNKITQLKNPDATFKVEDCVEAVHAFLLDNNILKNTIDISTIDIATNANSTSSRGILKPEIPQNGYNRIASHLRADLLSFCEQYGYDMP